MTWWTSGRRAAGEGFTRLERTVQMLPELRDDTSAAIVEPAEGADASSIQEVLQRRLVRSAFQPIVDLDSGLVVAYEALARGPVGALESPSELFAAARRTGNLAALDQVCREAAFAGAVDHRLVAPLCVFVNVEPEVLDSAPLDALLALADRAPGQLRVVMEITERALAARPAELLRTVQRVRAAGWGLALDDVGADPASLTFMPLLRPDVIKLDLSLVQRRPDRDIAQIMNAVNAHAEATGAVILAEGIETTAHLEVAHSLGASLGQGWHLGRPSFDPVASRPDPALPLPSPDGWSSITDESPFAALPSSTPLRRSTKPLLVQVSQQLEREALRLGDTCLVIAAFQEARHFTPATRRRYSDLADTAGFVAVLGHGLPREPLAGVRGADIVAGDPLNQEWDLVVLSPHFSAALLARDLGDGGPDRERRFEYALTYRRDIVTHAARSLLDRVLPRSPG
jgi:EAL domain-containing protein (putative c-di-GMP-specific phosphodiesterase class I)